MGLRRILWGMLVLFVMALLTVFVLQRAQMTARASADSSGGALAQSHRELLSSELQKFRLLPLVLVEYPEVASALAGGDEPARRRLNQSLELLASRTGAAVIYAINTDARTVAASNWQLPSSFVGQDFGFRPYFVDAMRDGMAELFALGTVSGRPGLYLARRVDVSRKAVGVIVVKVEFDQIEASWSRSPGATVVTDRNGVILITSVPSWRFRPTRRLDPAMINDARRSLQFGASPIGPPPFELTGRDARTREEPFRVARLDVPLSGSQLLHLSALAAPEAAARSQAYLWLLGIMLLIGVIGATSIRAAERRTMQRRARAALEEEVGRRTAELRESNARLAIESDERLEAERRFRAAREELGQANRLGSLGQITAGVAHEINQPLAAIRAFAENGTAYLARGATTKANDNLVQIVALTDRVGAITAELRAFSRRKSPSHGSATIGSILDGLMLLLGEQARAVVRIEVAQAERTIMVMGDRIRLEQILVNLVQNALDAVHGRPRPRITIKLNHGADQSVELRIFDNGAGVDPSIRDKLFTPFASTKEEGLGLGLAIARDLAREFGGELDHIGGKDGAIFILRLRQA